MSTFLIGREIVAEALRSGDIGPYLDAGLTLDFMRDSLHPAYAAVFTGQDIDAWLEILRHQDRFGKTPTLDMFRQSFPKGTYDLPSSRTTPGELTAMALDAVNQFEVEIGSSEAGRFIEAGDPTTAAEVMLATARKVLRQQADGSLEREWDNRDYDLQQRMDVVVERGPGTGIPELDDQFAGFQPGWLITYLGRAKAGKTSFLIIAAFMAWMGRTFMKGTVKSEIDPRRVLFVTTEITAEGVRDRLTAYGAGVNPSPFLASTEDHRPSAADRKKLSDFWHNVVRPYAVGALKVVQPYSRYTVADLEMDAEKHEPGVIFVDGFYFLYDPATKRMGAHWEAHDNLARELKALAMKLNVPIVVTHQVREKQLGKAGGGIDDGSMMGGTGLRMASDLVLGIDKDGDGIVTINNTASRNEYLRTIRGEWDWPNYRFEVLEDYDEDHPEKPEQWGDK